MCLISASLKKGQSSSFGPDVPNIWENPQLDSGSVKGAARNCRQNCVEGAAGNCRQDIVQNRVQNTQNVFKFGKETTSLDGVAGNCKGAVPKALCLTVLKGAGNCRQDIVQGNMAESSKCCGKLQPNREITGMAKTSRTKSSVVLRHGRTCSIMRWAILWVGKQESRATFEEFSSPCLDDHQFKQEELESVGEVSEVCSQIVLKCWYLARIGRP